MSYPFSFLKNLGACFLAIGSLHLCGGCSLQADKTASFEQSKTPNILIIMCDQLTPRVLSCYGGPVETPNIDRIDRVAG
jgi:hypothetical protein